MKTEYFTCDLCKEKIINKTGIMCMFFDVTKKSTLNQTFGCYTLSTDLLKSDKHICKSCIDLIKALT